MGEGRGPVGGRLVVTVLEVRGWAIRHLRLDPGRQRPAATRSPPTDKLQPGGQLD